MATPLREEGTLDGAGLERLIEHLILGGVHGLFILGTTGEGPALAREVQEEVIALTCRRVQGRVPILVGITNPCFADAVRLAGKANDCGANAVVAAPPYYYSVSQDDLIHYAARLAGSVPLPLFLYNAPSNTHHTLGVATVVRAADIENIAGLKDSGADMIYFHVLREKLRSRPDFTLLVGPEELLAEALLLGADGGMCAGSNVYPQLFVSLYEAAKAGDMERTAALHGKIMEFGSAIYRCAKHDANPLRGLKCALSEIGICGDYVAPPLQPYTAEERESVQRYVKSLEFAPVH